MRPVPRTKIRGPKCFCCAAISLPLGADWPQHQLTHMPVPPLQAADQGIGWSLQSLVSSGLTIDWPACGSGDGLLHLLEAQAAVDLGAVEEQLLRLVFRGQQHQPPLPIDAIRALVALDSQKQQMQLEEQDAQREKRLQKLLAILASGLAISGIPAYTRSRPTEKFLQRHVPQYAKPPHQPPAEVLWLTDIAARACCEASTSAPNLDRNLA